MDKLKMHSPNLTEDNIARIRDLFPGRVTARLTRHPRPEPRVGWKNVRPGSR